MQFSWVEEEADREQAESGEASFLPITLKASPVEIELPNGGCANRNASVPRDSDHRTSNRTSSIHWTGAAHSTGRCGNTRSIAYFEQAAEPKYLFNFKDAGHYTFTEMTQINPEWGDGIGVEKGDDDST